MKTLRTANLRSNLTGSYKKERVFTGIFKFSETFVFRDIFTFRDSFYIIGF